MVKRNVNVINAILASTGLLVLGIVLCRQADIVIPTMRIITLVVLAFLTVSRFIDLVLKKKKWQEDLLYTIVYLLIFLLILRYPNSYTRFIGLVTGLYALLNGVIHFIDYWFARKEHLEGTLFRLFRSILDILFGIVLMFAPLFTTFFLFIIAGVYLIVLGSFNLLTQIKSLFHEKFNITVSLPAILTALVPIRLYMKINNDPELMKNVKEVPEDSKYPLEVSVYTNEEGFASVGHIDVSYYGTIYSYGLHDPKARVLFGSAGEGVLVKTSRTAFFKNSLKGGKAMIFNFQFDLKEEELKVIGERLEQLMVDAVPFACDAKLQEEKGLPMTADDYISDVYKDTHCDLYKFKKGPFKTYFVFTQNCIQLTDFIIRNQEIDLLKMNGIITPGAYLSFLYQLYERKDSIIKELVIYKERKKEYH